MQADRGFDLLGRDREQMGLREGRGVIDQAVQAPFRHAQNLIHEAIQARWVAQIANDHPGLDAPTARRLSRGLGGLARLPRMHHHIGTGRGELLNDDGAEAPRTTRHENRSAR